MLCFKYQYFDEIPSSILLLPSFSFRHIGKAKIGKSALNPPPRQFFKKCSIHFHLTISIFIQPHSFYFFHSKKQCYCYVNSVLNEERAKSFQVNSCCIKPLTEHNTMNASLSK